MLDWLKRLISEEQGDELEPTVILLPKADPEQIPPDEGDIGPVADD